MSLFHFSEDPGIERFVPRTPASRPETEPLVWAVEGEYAATYTFPRDCARILLWRTPGTTDDDWRYWTGATAARFVAFVEWAALPSLQSARLYRYHMPAATFSPLMQDPWMWVSREAVTPGAVEPVGPLLEAMPAAGIELRLVPSLAPLRDAWNSTVHASGIRLANAVTWTAS